MRTDFLKFITMNPVVSTNLKTVFPIISANLDTTFNKLQQTEMTKAKSSSKMGRFTRVRYMVISKRVMGSRCGRMGQGMKASGTEIKLKAKANSCMRMAMSLMENGKRIKCQAKAQKYIKIVTDMLAKLKITSHTEMAFGIT